MGKTMAVADLYPFCDDADRLTRYCKLPLHCGVGRVTQHGDRSHPIAQLVRKMREATGEQEAEPDEQDIAAEFVVPATGNCLGLLHWPDNTALSQNFGEGLTVTGTAPDGQPFRFQAPVYYVQARSRLSERPGWSVAVPVNKSATITYGDPRPIAKVAATINNFDFEYGNVVPPESENGHAETLRVEAAGTTIDFLWRPERGPLRRLADVDLVRSTSLVDFTFAAWAGACDGDLVKFAHNVSGLCGIVAGQLTGIPVLSLFDAEGRVVRRILNGAIESPIRDDYALPVLHAADGLPKLFRECFEEHVKMQQSDLWGRLQQLYAVIEDPPFLEQKYATLMMGVELLIRGSLVEQAKMTQEEAETRVLPELIGAARKLLQWDIPQHYTEEDRFRKLRNAMGHGNPLPYPAAEVRRDFDKWHLFLRRRILMRLGFDGPVKSPLKGWGSSSNVDEFSEDHNSFRV
jgi:hypothetical protein